jgi:serine/threonine protein kinase
MNQHICREAMTHSLLEHRNIIPLLGVYREGTGEPPLIVLPYIEHGSLEEFMCRGHITSFHFTEIVSLAIQGFMVSSR